MGTRYKIVITELCEETKTKGKTWERGAGLANSGREGDYGYTPEIQKVVDVEREIYKQNVDSLDLKAVIMAVNGMGGMVNRDAQRQMEGIGPRFSGSDGSTS